ncbi:MAG: choice-of-anchor Q domain-containing protein [Gammaproteobacteria bacterium]
MWLFCLILAGPAIAATITVNTTVDQNPSAVDGRCSLREAVQAVIDTTAQDGCPAGSPEGPPNSFAGRDTIDFAVPFPATITLFTALPVLDRLDDGVIISGPGSRFLTIDGRNQVRVFRVGGAENVTIEGLTIANGRGIKNGGGILNSSGRLTVRNTRFTANTAEEDGGGISNEGVTATLSVLNSTFSGNVAVDFPLREEEGGAIVNIDGTVTISNSTFFGNSIPNQGGAIFNSGNNDGTGILTLINSTINSNTGALGGGGVFSEKQGTIILRNTLLAGNPGGNCGTETGGLIVDEGGNLDDGATCGLTFGPSLPNGMAGLDPLGVQNNGGLTDTVALTADSDAVDLGSNPVCADTLVSNLDQRGVARTVDGDNVNGAACDTGAYEFEPAPSTPPGPPSPPPPPAPPPPDPDEPAPICSGRTATVYVQSNDVIKGGPDEGQSYIGRLRGTPGRDVIVGRPGRDILLGSGGNDFICGGGGNDNIRGGAGNDRLFGQAGKDKLAGGPGSDRCDGGPGKDKLTTCERIANP